MEYSPSLGWMIDAYKSLSREYTIVLKSFHLLFSYKKNIKQLIIVHPSWWFKLLIGFMKNIVSSKFARKIVNIDSIDELETIINTTDMMIPADVRAYDQEENGEEYDEADLDKARAIMDSGRKPKVFNTPLEESCPDSDYPQEIKNLIEYITNKGLKSDGIFRRSPNKSKMDTIIQLMDEHQPINFDEYDIYTLASVLKEFIRTLPETLIPESTYPLLSDPSITTMEPDQLILFIQSKLLASLDSRHYKLLRDLMMLSAMTAQLQKSNRMTSKVLAVVWAPNMVRMEKRGDELKVVTMTIRVMECMIENYDTVFCKRIKD